jgi:hypothetical protein
MSDDALRSMLIQAVAILREATDLTMDEVIGVRALAESTRTPDVIYSMGILDGAATALRCTRREMLEDFDLLTAPKRA